MASLFDYLPPRERVVARASVQLEVRDPIVEAPFPDIDYRDYRTTLRGALVRSGRPNLNGAYWELSDLEFGLESVKGSPVNLLHQTKRVVGYVTEASIVSDQAHGEHIAIEASLWDWVAAEDYDKIMSASYTDQLYLSMECVSSSIQCTGPSGCGREVSFFEGQSRTGDICSHLKDGSSWRRYVRPAFDGAAIILPPVQPGWSEADAEVDVFQVPRAWADNG